ncbi:hypothetical protein D3C76_826180 [compost metagenome]
MAQRQPFHVATRLHGAAAAPVATRHCLGYRVALQQRTEHADGKGIAGANGVHHMADRHWRHLAFALGAAEVGTGVAQLDHHQFHPLVEVERGDVCRGVLAGQQAALFQAWQNPVGLGRQGIDFAHHAALVRPQRGAQVGVERDTAPGGTHGVHQRMRQRPTALRQRRRDAGGVQVAGLQRARAQQRRRQPAGRRATAEVLHRRVAAVIAAGLELEAGGVAGIHLDAGAVQAFAAQAVEHEAAQRIVAHPAQPADLEAQPRQADGHVAVGAGDALAELADTGQVAGLLGDEHGHGLAETQHVMFMHGSAPHSIRPAPAPPGRAPGHGSAPADRRSPTGTRQHAPRRG